MSLETKVVLADVEKVTPQQPATKKSKFWTDPSVWISLAAIGITINTLTVSNLRNTVSQMRMEVIHNEDIRDDLRKWESYLKRMESDAYYARHSTIPYYVFLKDVLRLYDR